MSRVAIIGAGAWGTTLSLLCAEKGHEVNLWVFEKDLAAHINEYHENNIYFPGFQLPENITATSEEKHLKNSDAYLFVVPTQFLRATVRRFKAIVTPASLIISASKGIEDKTLKMPLEILAEELKIKNNVALSGPNLSKEIGRGLPATCVVAASDIKLAQQAQKLLMLERFRVYVNDDPIGVQLGGALKNIIAIAAGIADGLELGDNAKSALMIRGIAEIARLGIALGAKKETFAGLSGMGDLITTCSSKLSRNHCVGEQIAQGKKLKDIQTGMKAVAEGIPTCSAALALAKKHNVQMPVTNEVYEVLYRGKKAFQSINDLMTRSATSE
jgi:glycerol-3-phosphate dehydrogenase (NAD(P)+)